MKVNRSGIYDRNAARWLAALLFIVVALWAMSATAAGELPDLPENAIAEDAYDDGEARVANWLLLDADEVAPGETISAGVLFEMDPQWHIYWHYAGQGGMSTAIDITADQGAVGPVMWPEPTVYHEAGGSIITFGYGDQVLLFSEIELPDDIESPVEITADVDYLVCKVDCIPGQANLSRIVDLGEKLPEHQSSTNAIFDAARAAVPKTPEETGVDAQVSYSHAPIESSDRFRIELQAIGCMEEGDKDCVELAQPPERAADALVYEGMENISLDVARVGAHPEAFSGWFIEIEGRASRDAPSGDSRFSGVLRLRDADGTALATAFDELFPRTDTAEGRALALGEAADVAEASPDEDGLPPQEEGLSLFYVLLLAFLGGALLNLMPCVFPVLAVKVFAFVNLVHEERQSVHLHSALYTGGIVASMMVLAAAVIGLQVVGTQVGWGFQFQEPLFVAAVGAVVVIFALNLFGAFEVTLGPGRLQEVTQAPSSPRRSFGEGVLAVILATPCSAPFLGTAVGFALASSPPYIALIFAVLGIGLATPFVVLTMIPGAAKVLPKPGPWMEHFKQVLGFALLATAIWLLWLMGQMVGVGAMTRVLIFFLACAVAVWLFGVVQFRSTRARRIGLVFAVAIIVVTGVLTLRFDEESGDAAQVEASSSAPIDWKEWSDDAVADELAAGRPVFVDFTADWCITCKVNEANVLEHRRVLEAIDEHDVAMFMADWTRRDERIRSKLAEFGKGGVPMYLVYSPDDPDNPELLPEVLTRQLVVDELKNASRL